MFDIRRPGARGRVWRALTGVLLAGTVGAATACSSISTQQEAQLGADYSAQVNQELPIVDDATLNRYINQLGGRIAPDGTFDYRFFIVNADAVNAFAIPGGYVYVNRGLVEHADNESELAGVLAHEVGHVVKRHSVEQLERAQDANLGVNLAYILMGRQPSGVEQAAIGVGGNLVFASYSREAEDEADEVAIPLMMDAGYDPEGLLTFFEELLAQEQRSPSQLETWFSTHPTTQDRIEATRRRIQAIPAARRRGLATDGSGFASFKRRLAGYPAPPSDRERDRR